MFFCWPGTHVDPDLGNQTESRRLIDAIDPSQVDATDSKRFSSNVEFHLISPLLVDPAGGFDTRWFSLGLQTPDMLRNLLIAFDDLLLIVVKRFQRLLQRKQVFRSVIA